MINIKMLIYVNTNVVEKNITLIKLKRQKKCIHGFYLCMLTKKLFTKLKVLQKKKKKQIIIDVKNLWKI